MEDKKYYTGGTVWIYNGKIKETEAQSIPLTHMHDRSHSLLDTSTLIESGGV